MTYKGKGSIRTRDFDKLGYIMSNVLVHTCEKKVNVELWNGRGYESFWNLSRLRSNIKRPLQKFLL